MFPGNRYQLLEPIGRGLMAIIYRGIDTQTDQAVAVKTLKEVYIRDPKFVSRFQKEAEVMYSLHHPNIVQVYDYGQTNGYYYMVMESIEGIDLRRYVHSEGLLDAEKAVKIAHDVALGLGAAHRQGIVHRSVIPQHILLGRDGSIKLTGFSIASVYGMSREKLSIAGSSLNIVFKKYQNHLVKSTPIYLRHLKKLSCVALKKHLIGAIVMVHNWREL